jgi:hypothetical protein
VVNSGPSPSKNNSQLHVLVPSNQLIENVAVSLEEGFAQLFLLNKPFSQADYFQFSFTKIN